MEFYDRIRETRKDKDIGQKEIADILKITQQQYSLYETGKGPCQQKCYLSFAYIFKLAQTIY